MGEKVKTDSEAQRVHETADQEFEAEVVRRFDEHEKGYVKTFSFDELAENARKAFKNGKTAEDFQPTNFESI